MPGFSARKMLSQLPLRMAHGGDVGNYLSSPAYAEALREGKASSAAYKRAEQNGADGVQAYYQGLREVAQTYLADTDAPTGAEAYNVMIEAGISTTDLINAGVGEDVLSKIWTITEDPSFFTLPPTDLESAWLRDPVLMAEAAHRSAGGEDGVASLQQQARDYVAHVKEDGITDAERTEMQHYATTRGYTVQDFLDTGVDPSILYKTPTGPTIPPAVCAPGTQLEGQPMPASGDCNPEKFPTTQVCPAGSELEGQTIAIEASCDPSTVTTAPTVYSQPEAPADIYAAGAPALDKTFRESAPRTETTIPGQYTYTPAAKLLPATGAGYSWTPPSVTSRPRSLLSPLAIQQYGGLTSASSRFAQNRRTMDSTILQAFRTADVYDPSAIRDFRQQARAGLFSNDQGAFDLDQFQSAFDTYISLRPTADTTDTTDTTDKTGGQRSDSWWNRFPRYGPLTDEDRSGAASSAEGDMSMGADMGYFGPITPVDLRYGVPGMFAKGGPVSMSAKNMLAQYANGGSVSAGRNLESEGWTKTGVADPLYIHEDPPYVDRINNPQNYPVINNPDGSVSTHRMSAEVDEHGIYGPAGNWYVFPTVQMQDGALKVYDDNREAMKNAFETGNYLKAPNKEEALKYAEGAYKEGTLLADPQAAQTESASMLRDLDTSAMEEIQRRPKLGPPPAGRDTDQTESASMLESIMEGASMIPETVANYFIRPGDKGPASFSMVSPSEVGSDIKFLGGTMWEGAKADPFTFAMDILPIIGEIRSAGDVGKFTDMANKAEAEGKPALADMFRQIVALSAAGAVPLAGMGARVTKRSVISAAKKAAEEAATTATASARLLDEVVVADTPRLDMPETGRPVHAADMSPEEFKNVTNNMYGHQGDLKTPQEMVARANRIGPQFQDAIRDITDQLGLVKSETFGIKELRSLTDKMDRGYKLDRVTDPIRTRIMINTAEEADQVARMISDIMPVQDRGWQRLGPSGYFDRKLNVLYTSPSGEKLIGEVQITLPRMSEAVTPPKGLGHRYYEVERELIRIYGSEDAIPSTHRRRFNWARQQMKDMYSEIEASADPKIVESIMVKPDKDLVPIVPTSRARPPPAESTSARGAL